jgi:hypothetical protein
MPPPKGMIPKYGKVTTAAFPAPIKFEQSKTTTKAVRIRS